QAADKIQSSVRMIVGFDMDADDVGARLRETLDVAGGLRDHQMDIERQLCHLSRCSNNRSSPGDVGYKVPIHYVDMDIVGSARFDVFDLVRQVSKIGAQNGGSDEDTARHRR